MFLSSELVAVIELSIFSAHSSRVVRNLEDLNCYTGSFVFSAVNFYGREEGVESRAIRVSR